MRSDAQFGESQLVETSSVSHRVNRERIVLLGWVRAILLQFAHPLVAAGVRGHTDFHGGLSARLGRLRHTVQAMLDFSFGPPEATTRASRTVNRIHDRVQGRLEKAVGPFPSGTPYSARDPELLTWVHVTVVDSTLLVYQRLIESLSPEERDQYWLDAAGIAPLLGIPEGRLPTSTRDAAAYMTGLLGSDTITVGDEARELAHQLLRPGFGPDLPLQWVVRLVGIGLLPETVRAGYGFRWGPVRAALLRVTEAGLRTALAVAPTRLRHWRRAREHS